MGTRGSKKKAAKRSKRSVRGNAAEKKARHEFVSEAEEILERMREDLADLADQRGGGGEVEPDLVNRIFRSAHSLKGLAGMFGLGGVSELAHHMEDVLDGLRLGRISMEAPAVDLLDEVVGLFASILSGLESSDSCAVSAEVITDLIGRITAAVVVPSETAAEEDLEAESAEETEQQAGQDVLQRLALDSSLLRALTEYEEHRLRENIRRGRQLSLVDSTFEIIAFEDGLSDLSAAIREVGEVVSTLPSPGDAPESQIRFSLLVATEITTEQLAQRLDPSSAAVQCVLRAPDAQSPETPVAKPAGLEGAETTPGLVDGGETELAGRQPAGAPAPKSGSPSATPEIESLRSISETVRVDIRKLDELMNLVGELVIQRNSIASIATRLMAESDTSRIGRELTKTHKLLDRKLKDLQAGVLDVRMVPLRQVFEKLSRVVRRLKRDRDKNVGLKFKGSDTELDKLIVERLVDPLMHVVRNAFDHAIEESKERVAAGKPADGAILIDAFQRGNHVVIEVRDDGRGIDPSRVRAAAEAQGLLSPDDALPEAEILDLVFLPGLSTREEVSETSGRGVGMDVVRANLSELGGMVEISSTLGQGTTVCMTLPITLAIIQALIVGVGKQRFGIPLNSVHETLLLQDSEIQRSEGREMLNLRGDPLRLQRLSEFFDLEANPPEGYQYVVVLGMGDQRVGLIVDRLHGQQDAVIKPIQGPIHQIPGVAGATELGDRGAILVIDVSHIVSEVVRRREAA